jgi:Zn finger protein HypA/HybF involved in hydrogenase expression
MVCPKCDQSLSQEFSAFYCPACDEETDWALDDEPGSIFEHVDEDQDEEDQ